MHILQFFNQNMHTQEYGRRKKVDSEKKIHLCRMNEVFCKDLHEFFF
jgi:hypothetical protein